MTQFFFDFCQDNERIPDGEGMEFADVEQAFLEAYEGAQEMWSDLLKRRQDPRRCRFEVRDANRQLLFIFPFQEVLDACQDRKPVAIHHTIQRACHTAQYAKRVSDDFRDELRTMHSVLKQSRALLTEEV